MVETNRKFAMLKLDRRDDWDGWTSEVAPCAKLLSAVGEGDEKEERRLLTLGVSMRCRNTNGATPLCLANRPEIAKLLIEAGADVNETCGDGMAPIHVAAFQGNLAVLRVLLENGADVNAKGGGSKSPLHLAAFMFDAPAKGADYFGVVELLVERGADVNAVDKSGDSPLLCAKNERLAAFLGEKGAKSVGSGGEYQSFVELLEIKSKKIGAKLSIAEFRAMEVVIEGENGIDTRKKSGKNPKGKEG